MLYPSFAKRINLQLFLVLTDLGKRNLLKKYLFTRSFSCKILQAVLPNAEYVYTLYIYIYSSSTAVLDCSPRNVKKFVVFFSSHYSCRQSHVIYLFSESFIDLVEM